jgi:hypothetical protein
MTRMTDGMKWFKNTFGGAVATATANTPYTLDFLTAIAVQESFEIWGNIFDSHPTDKVLELCVGDTIDGPSRKAFPTSKSALLSMPRGAEVFAVAREELEAVGQVNASYHRIAISNPNKFCHGFGIFQYDIQFCKSDSDYFINKGWKIFANALAKAITELKAAQKKAKLNTKSQLTDEELAHVAIAYNTGSFNPARGLKQGFKDSTGKFYGELIAQYIALAHTV